MAPKADAKKASKRVNPPPRKKTGELNERQRCFVDEYLIDLNATQAAIRAGYSLKTAGAQGFALLQKTEIQGAIEKARQKTANKLEITRERVLLEFARLAFVDPRAFYNEDGSLKKVTDLDQDTAAALTGMEVDEIRVGDGEASIGVTRKIKWADKRGALDSINRMMGWNEDKLKLQGDPNAPLEVKTKIVLVPMKQIAETSVKPLEGRDD